MTASTFFETPAAFRRWLRRHHATAAELWVGFYKKDSGKPSLTWPESVDQALCFGWIDGIRKRLDDVSYTIRFTPRKPDSTWSTVNVRNARRLAEAGLMQPAGLKAFQARSQARLGTYSYEQKQIELDGPLERELRRHRRAWEFFQAQPPGYRKKACGYVMSAKQEATRRARLERLIASWARGKRDYRVTGKKD